MDYSKQHLIELGLKTNFIKDNLEKVLRLDDIAFAILTTLLTASRLL